MCHLIHPSNAVCFLRYCSKKSLSADGAPVLSPTLGEILPNMVNRLSPTNIKRTANSLMDEWERSLLEPRPSTDKENRVDEPVPAQ